MYKKMPMAGKKGGGKLKPVAGDGDRGIPKAGAYPSKATIGRIKGNIDAPGEKGDRGIPSGGKTSAKPPLD